jgi:putative thiamine transport system permease protein
MAAPLRRVIFRTAPAVAAGRLAARGAAIGLFVLPLAAALPLALAEAANATAWRNLLADPQLPRSLVLSVWTATASTLAALALALVLVTAFHGTRGWARLAAWLAPMLAVPHAAFAIGLAWLIAPAGWLARALAPLAGWAAPPAWVTVGDPQGIALTGVLVLKELPFLLWNAVALLARPEAAAWIERQVAIARTLGYSRRSWWHRLGWLHWLPHLRWPLLAVLAYGLTVVDIALVIGPNSPPPLALLGWQGLTDASPARQAEGAAAAWVLAGLLALLSVAGWWLWRRLAAALRAWAASGRRPKPSAAAGQLALRTAAERPGDRAAGALFARGLFGAVLALYGAVLVVLVTLSFAGVWTFPALWPPEPTVAAWQQVQQSSGTVGLTVALALASAALALVIAIGWLEAAPPRWDARAAPVVLAPIVVPQLLWMAGLYQGTLHLRLDGTLGGLLWVHVLVVLPYVFTAVAPAWRSFDPRFEHTAVALGSSRWRFWWRVKWPLLAAPLASALAVGFAVSVAQYLATQFIGTGRHPTITTEAVTLASGGQRNLAAAFALLQAALPLAGFGLAHLASRRRL